MFHKVKIANDVQLVLMQFNYSNTFRANLNSQKLGTSKQSTKNTVVDWLCSYGGGGGMSVVGSTSFIGIKKGVMGLTSSVNLGCIGAFSANGILSRGSSPWKYRTVRGEHSVSLSRRSGQ